MTSLVFPGQGSQFTGMSKDFYDNFSAARDIFEIVSDTTKIDLRDIIFNNPSNYLNQTQFTQISIFCSSMSIFNVLKKEIGLDNLNIDYMLGHSLGEYSALSAAGILSIENCSQLLKIRGELMQNAYEPNKSGMAAIIGLNCATVENIINQNNLDIEIANDNSPMQVVVSGILENLKGTDKFFMEKGAKKFIILNVSAAFHSMLMNKAENVMKNYINDTLFKFSNINIISNFSGKASNDNDILIKNLSMQMSNRVRWVESIASLEASKDKKIIEIGPGRVLTGLIKRISSNFVTINLEKISDIENIKNVY